MSVTSFKNAGPRNNKCVRWKGGTRIRTGTAKKDNQVRLISIANYYIRQLPPPCLPTYLTKGAIWQILTSHILLNISYIMVMISIAFSFISYTTILPTQYNLICRV